MLSDEKERGNVTFMTKGDGWGFNKVARYKRTRNEDKAVVNTEVNYRI
jgi:hypothetical protein